MKTMNNPNMLHKIELQKLSGRIYINTKQINKLRGIDDAMIKILEDDLQAVYARIIELEEHYDLRRSKQIADKVRGFKR